MRPAPNMAPDISWSRQLAGISVSQIALWAVAGTMVMAAHGSAGWWIMQERPAPMAAAAAPAAIMIEFAPLPAAPSATEEQIAPDEVDSIAAEEVPVETTEEIEVEEALVPVEPEPVLEVEETPPEPIEPVETVEAVEPEPVEEVVEEILEPIDPIEEQVAALDPVELPLPQARPQPPRPQEVKQEKPKEQRKKAAPRKAKQQPSAEKRRAQVVTQQEAPRAAARQNSSGASSSVSPARWQARVHSHIAKRQRRNVVRKAGEAGVSQVRFSIDGNGKVLSASLARSSGNSILDDEAVSMVRRSSPIPAPPPGVNRTIILPVQFSMR